MATIEESNANVESILEEARKERLKGRYYIYEQYKSRLWDACISTTQFSQAIIDLAKALRV